MAERIKIQNEYQIIDFSSADFPYVEVKGKSFCHEDLYELSGRYGFMTTFNLKAGSPSRSEYGESLTGIILYPPNATKESANDGKLKIRYFSPNDLKPETIEELKYGGLSLSDIESVSFLLLKREMEFHETGEKKVPGIISIELDLDKFEKIDITQLQQSLLVRKNNAGVKLTSYEKEELVGITLAINNRRIDSRILDHLGFSKETMMANTNV